MELSLALRIDIVSNSEALSSDQDRPVIFNKMREEFQEEEPEPSPSV